MTFALRIIPVPIQCEWNGSRIEARMILLVVGVMDLRAMTIVAAAITLERLAPSGESVARAIGAGIVGIGLFLIVRAAWFA